MQYFYECPSCEFEGTEVFKLVYSYDVDSDGQEVRIENK